MTRELVDIVKDIAETRAQLIEHNKQVNELRDAGSVLDTKLQNLLNELEGKK